MVYQSAQKLDRIFHALADGTRRDMLRRLSKDRLSIKDLAQHYDMTLPGASKHVKVLEQAELIRIERLGRSFVCVIRPNSLNAAAAQIEFYKDFWKTQLEQFETLLVKGIRND